MATEQRETWRDWLPDDATAPATDLLTRAELLERLAAINVEATEADLRYWEYERILPRPVRQGFRGATRAVYPWMAIFMVAYLRALQIAGLSLREIGAHLRDSVPGALRSIDIIEDFVLKNVPLDQPLATRKRNSHRDTLIGLRAKQLARSVLLSSLDDNLIRLAGQYLAITDQFVEEITITFRGEDDKLLDEYQFKPRDYLSRRSSGI